MTNLPGERLSGEFSLHPGVHPSVRGHRPVLQPGRLGNLLHGKSPAQVSQVLSQVFTLCAHAHCRTSRLLFEVRGPSLTSNVRAQADVFHWLETARDHLRSIALD